MESLYMYRIKPPENNPYMTNPPYATLELIKILKDNTHQLENDQQILPRLEKYSTLTNYNISRSPKEDLAHKCIGGEYMHSSNYKLKKLCKNIDLSDNKCGNGLRGRPLHFKYESCLKK